MVLSRIIHWLKSRTILERVLSVNLAIILIMSAFGLVTLARFNHVVGIGKDIEDHPLTVGSAVLHIETAAAKIDDAFKTILASGSQQSFQQYQSVLQEQWPVLQGDFSSVEGRYLGDQNAVQTVLANCRDWLQWNEQIITALKRHAPPEAIASLSFSSWRSHDVMIDGLRRLSIFAQNKARSFVSGLRGQRQQAKEITYLFVLMAMAMATVLSYVIGKTISGPIRSLQRVMRELAKGNLEVDLPEIAAERFEADAIAKAASAMKADASEKNALVKRTEDARKKAEAANQAKTQFLAMMSHELRTPMNAIIGVTQVLEGMELPTEVRENMDLLSTGSQTLMAILSDVLDLSKIEAGKLEIENTDFDFHKLLSQARQLWAPRAQDKALNFDLQIGNDVPHWLHSDQTRLRQIIFNLLSNAIKFTQNGAIEIKVHCTGGSDSRADLCIDVKDSGIGISPDNLSNLFRPFEQADSSITRRFGGTGLGLSISQQLARLLGGSLTVASEQGKGSVFTLKFSATKAIAVATNRSKEATGALNRQALSILVAEDNALNVKVLKALLKPFPYELVHAENGEIALQLLENRVFDLVLMDIQMPVLDGLSAVQELRAGTGPNRHVPVIAMTANAMAGDKAHFMAAGMSGYVSKPIDARMLFAAIAKCVAQPKQPRQPDRVRSESAA